MNTDLLTKFEPMLSVALERFQRFQNPEPRDITKIFGPVLQTICNVAGVDNARAASIIESWDPAAITADTLRSAVAEITKPAMANMVAARAKQEALELELSRDAAAHPLTARDIVLLERKKPMGERSRDSITGELFEFRAHCVRLAEANENGNWGGEHLPGAVIDYMESTEGEARKLALENELYRRDCDAHGISYTPHVPKRNHSLDMVPAMRG
jgi:hypothetical protein